MAGAVFYVFILPTMALPNCTIAALRDFQFAATILYAMIILLLIVFYVQCMLPELCLVWFALCYCCSGALAYVGNLPSFYVHEVNHILWVRAT